MVLSATDGAVLWPTARMAAGYAIPVGVVLAELAWWPASGIAILAGTGALVAACQALLLRAHVRAAWSARFDPLTGLPGRAVLLDRLRRALTGPAEVGLVFVDLDGFKQVNDTYGHVTGDRVLVEVAGRLRRLAGASVVVARYGGDEFAILVPPGSAAIEAVAERIDHTIRRPVPVAGETGQARIELTASIGVARSVGGPVDEMLAAADQAMYAAKRRPTYGQRSRMARHGVLALDDAGIGAEACATCTSTSS